MAGDAIQEHPWPWYRAVSSSEMLWRQNIRTLGSSTFWNVPFWPALGMHNLLPSNHCLWVTASENSLETSVNPQHSSKFVNSHLYKKRILPLRKNLCCLPVHFQAQFKITVVSNLKCFGAEVLLNPICSAPYEAAQELSFSWRPVLCSSFSAVLWVANKSKAFSVVACG